MEFELDEKSILLKQLEIDLSQKDEEDKSEMLRNELREIRHVVDDLHATVREKGDRIGLLEEENEKVNNTVRTLEEHNAKLTADIVERKDILNAIQKELDTKTEKIAALEQQMELEADKFESQYKEIRAKNERISELELIIVNNEDSQREKSNYELEKSENFKLNLENVENDNIRCKLEIENLERERDHWKALYDSLGESYERLNTGKCLSILYKYNSNGKRFYCT